MVRKQVTILTQERPRPTKESAGWFGSGDRHLFGWLHCPKDGSAKGAVVLCPPLLEESYWAQETFRCLAKELAQAGIAALRFQYSATGNSSTKPEDIDDICLWAEDIAAAVKELRSRGADFVAVVAMRAAANLVAASPLAQTCGDAVVLWDPASSGRAWLRQAVLFHRTLATSGKQLGTKAELTKGDLEAQPREAASGPGDLVGFDFPPAFLESLRQMKFGRLDTTAPVLVLTRTGKPPVGLGLAPNLAFGLADGQEALFEGSPWATRMPLATVSAIVSWLGALVPEREHATFINDLSPVWSGEAPVRFTERTGKLGDRELFAIFTEPVGARPVAGQEGTGPLVPLTCLMFNSGMLDHTGPQRFYVDLARGLAAEGVRSVRLDFSGIGESPAPLGDGATEVYSPSILRELDEVVAAAGPGPVAVLGQCSGAYHSLEAAARRPLVGALAVHPVISFQDVLLRPGAASPDRLVGGAFSDRPWVSAIRRTWIGQAVLWRMPGQLWWLLDKIGLQQAVSRGVSAASRNGTEVVLVLEDGLAQIHQLWPLVHRKGHRARIEWSRADHSLWDASRRSEVYDLCLETARHWASKGVKPVRRSTSEAPGAWAVLETAASPGTHSH